jgi:hypothetical protein
MFPPLSKSALFFIFAKCHMLFSALQFSYGDYMQEIKPSNCYHKYAMYVCRVRISCHQEQAFLVHLI